MSDSLQEKCIVIIGGTTGMGLSAARAFAKRGARLVVMGNSEESVLAAGKELGRQAKVLYGNAESPSAASDAIDACVREFGNFHGLYHVAGGSGRKFGDGPLHECSLEGWNKTIEWNLGSLMLSNQAAIRYWLKSDTGGTILNMSSVLAFAPSPKYFSTHAYAAAKAAIIGFSQSIAAYYAGRNIRVNVIAAGLVQTPMALRAANDENIMRYIKSKQPLDGGRIGQPGDLDGLAVYFMSDDSRFTTGQVIAVDGGWSLSEGQYQ